MEVDSNVEPTEEAMDVDEPESLTRNEVRTSLEVLSRLLSQAARVIELQLP